VVGNEHNAANDLEHDYQHDHDKHNDQHNHDCCTDYDNHDNNSVS
jgi:hypothetical protein